MNGKISIADAAQAGIQRVRLPYWSCKMDHIKIDIIDNKPGPWLHLWCPYNKECNDRDPVDMLWMIGPTPMDIHKAEFEIYTGPLPDSEEYQKAVAAYSKIKDNTP